MTNPTGNAELKPCPFCGNKAELHFDCDHHGNWFNLGCSDESCHAHHAFYTEELRELDEAIEAWNTRTASGEGK